MKKIIYINILLFTLFLGGCTAGFEEMNQNPNNPTQTHPKLLLTNICWKAFGEASTTPLYASRMLVQSDGESAQQFYKWTRGSYDYYLSMRDVEKMKQEAEAADLKGYVALSHFFRAHYFFNLALTYGDIPYSEALQGEVNSIFTPKYDTQEAVLTGVLSELKTAEEILSKEKNPLEGDIIFKGDLMKWRKAINAYRLKVLMTLSAKAESSHSAWKTEFAQVYSAGVLMTSVADNAQVEFLDQQGNRYPRFNDSGFGSGMYMDSTFIQRMAERKDPRLFTFVTQTKNALDAGKDVDDFTSYEGGNPIAPYNTVNAKAVAGNISKPHSRFYANPTNEPIVLMGYPEQELIIAEAIVRGWIGGNAQTHYNNGVKGSFKFYETYAKGYASYLKETDADNYLSQPLVALLDPLTKEQKIERIIMQRYFQSYFQGMWTAYIQNIRTGYPGFAMPANTTLPQRWMYPQTEYNNNTKNVEEAIKNQFGAQEDITTKTWWVK